MASPSLDLSGIDALIASYSSMIDTMTAKAAKDTRRANRANRIERRNNRIFQKSLLDEIAAAGDPGTATPAAPTRSNADVQRAALQARMDSGRRFGLKRSIIAGETGASSALSPFPQKRSLISAVAA